MNKEKRSKSIGKILIDLTPLLDVVFIVLIVVFASQKMTIEDSQSAAQAAESSQAAAEAQNAVMAGQMENYDDINTYFTLISVYAGFEPSNRVRRTIYIKINDGDMKTIAINPSDQDKRWEECERYIEEAIGRDGNLYTILSVNTVSEEGMLYRDEQRILKMFGDISSKHANVYVKGM
ncbi:MAG: hypothetical protein K6G81_00075 [Lachnospiraceae bacterium]|nr:hypothetical protein [Lachnospiraceae bacterium]